MTYYTDSRPSVAPSVLDAPVGYFDAMEAAWDEAIFTNPTSALGRITELADAERGEFRFRRGERGYGEYVREEPDSPMLSADEARFRVEESGLDLKVPDEGIREGALDILMNRKREEVQRQFILSRAPKGSMPAQFAAGLAASLIDPLNVASGFVPVVGQARYAGMLAKASTPLARAGVRARVGALEGAVGAAILEPLPLIAARQDQTDYDLYDSLLNIAFGSILGGGLHAAGGAIRDYRSRKTVSREELFSTQEGWTPARHAEAAPKTREHLSRIRLSEAGEWQPSELGGTLAVDSPQQFGKAMDIVARQVPIATDGWTFRNGAFEGTILARMETGQVAEIRVTPKPMVEARAERAPIEKALDEVDISTAQGRARAQKLEKQIRSINDKALSRLDEKWRPYVDRARVSQGTTPTAEPPPAETTPTARERVEAAGPQVREKALRAGVAQAVTGREIDVNPVFGEPPEPPPRQVDEPEQIDDIPDDLEVPAEIEALVADADGYANALKAGAFCLREKA